MRRRIGRGRKAGGGRGRGEAAGGEEGRRRRKSRRMSEGAEEEWQEKFVAV